MFWTAARAGNTLLDIVNRHLHDRIRNGDASSIATVAIGCGSAMTAVNFLYMGSFDRFKKKGQSN